MNKPHRAKSDAQLDLEQFGGEMCDAFRKYYRDHAPDPKQRAEHQMHAFLAGACYGFNADIPRYAGARIASRLVGEVVAEIQKKKGEWDFDLQVPPTPKDGRHEGKSGGDDFIAFYTSANRGKVFMALLEWFAKHGLFTGESIVQSDVASIEGPELLSELAELFEFEVDWKDA